MTLIIFFSMFVECRHHLIRLIVIYLLVLFIARHVLQCISTGTCFPSLLEIIIRKDLLSSVNAYKYALLVPFDKWPNFL